MHLITPELLAACNTEPIHRPGAVHPHGVLLTCDHAGVVLQVSANARDWFGLPAGTLPGTTIHNLLPQPLVAGILSLPEDGEDAQPRRLPAGAIDTTAFGRITPLATAVHRRRLIIIELERTEPERNDHGPSYAHAITALAGAEDQRALCAATSRMLAPVVGYDRVMVYAFHPGGEGEVVGEWVAPGIEPYLGLHYPASDVPEQARALYLRNTLRVLSDAEAEPVPVLPAEPPDGGGPLDMSLCPLRAHSPLYREYIRNMGATASMVASVIVNRRLWGLIICNHPTPRTPCGGVRDFTAAMAALLASRLVEQERGRILERRHKAMLIVERVAQAIQGSPQRGWIEPLSDQVDPLLALLDATGFALVTSERVLGLRQAPPAAAIRAALAVGGPGTIHDGTNRSIAGALGGIACGMLAVPVARGVVLCWFRPEHVHEVTWGGDMSQLSKSFAVRPDGVPVFTPRRSFAAWTQQVRGLCRPWSVDDRTAADTLARGLAHSVVPRPGGDTAA